MFEKDGLAGTLCPVIMAKCGFGGARPPGKPPSMTQHWVVVQFSKAERIWGEFTGGTYTPGIGSTLISSINP